MTFVNELEEEQLRVALVTRKCLPSTGRPCRTKWLDLNVIKRLSVQVKLPGYLMQPEYMWIYLCSIGLCSPNE